MSTAKSLFEYCLSRREMKPDEYTIEASADFIVMDAFKICGSCVMSAAAQDGGHSIGRLYEFAYTLFVYLRKHYAQSSLKQCIR
jgi:hypothetical protein